MLIFLIPLKLPTIIRNISWLLLLNFCNFNRKKLKTNPPTPWYHSSLTVLYIFYLPIFTEYVDVSYSDNTELELVVEGSTSKISCKTSLTDHVRWYKVSTCFILLFIFINYIVNLFNQNHQRNFLFNFICKMFLCLDFKYIPIIPPKPAIDHLTYVSGDTGLTCRFVAKTLKCIIVRKIY